jgi:hypothetical protein
MKRLSTLDTLRQEGSDPAGENGGRGLYKHTEEKNDKNIAEARQRIEEQRKETASNLKDYERKMKAYLNAVATGRGTAAGNPPVVPTLKPAPSIPEVEKINDDLSHYVSFKHPWGSIVFDPAVLLVMFFGLFLMTLIALRSRDKFSE